jgi:programmed cell death protein 4
MASFPTQSSAPVTKTKEGSAKRNILRKGTPGVIRKENSARGSSGIDDGSVNPISGAIDDGDPNYDSEEEWDSFGLKYDRKNHQNVRSWGESMVGDSKMTLTTYKKDITPIIKEYLRTGDVDEALEKLDQVAAPEYGYEFIKRSINTSFDMSDRERERLSKLISIAYPDVFSSNMIGKGFERLFELVDEIEKDCPNCREMLSIFLARCVVDEVLPPSFLSDSVVKNLGGDIVNHTKRMLSRDHAGAKLERIWGPGDGRPVSEMKIAIDQLLEEYLISKDLDEACRCIKELNAPDFFHEIIKRAVVHILDKSEDNQQAMSNLFIVLVERDMLTTAQATKAFKRLYDILDDLLLDIPIAGKVLAKFTAWAIEENILPSGFSV